MERSAHSHHRLEIEGIIDTAARLASQVKAELSKHEGLIRCSSTIEQAARNAAVVSARMRRPLSLHRLPVLFLGLALVALVSWTYVTFFRVTGLTLALPDRDAAELKDVLKTDPRLSIEVVEVAGSREASKLVGTGQVDLAFVQGGVPVPPILARAELPSREVVLLFLKPGIASLDDARVVLTSTEGEGSHSVLLELLRLTQAPRLPVLRHEWSALTVEGEVVVPGDIDAVFVVKDPSDEKTLRAVRRLAAAGFELSEVAIGAPSKRLIYLEPTTLDRGWLSANPAVPSRAVSTWSVSTFLVARDGLTPRLLAQAVHLVQPVRNLTEIAVVPSTTMTSEVLQGVDAFFSILINIGLGFLALLGLDAWAYRRQFHELNSLVSVLSQLQSNKDVLALKDDAVRKENMHYLSLVSDLLGVVSHISNYYTQENSALVFNNLSDVIHERCNALKLNIQLKLLQSAIRD